MPITRGTERTGVGASTTTTITNVTCSGTDRYLEAVISFTSSSFASAATFNGSESMTLVKAQNGSSGGTGVRIETWALVAPSATTADVVFTHSNAFVAARAQPYAGVDQATPRDTAISSGGAGTSAVLSGTLTWGGSDDELVLWAAHRNSSYTFTADAGVTQVGSQNSSGTGSSHSNITSLQDSDTETGKVAGALSTSTGWAVIGYNLNAAGSVGASTAPIVAHYNLQGTL